MNTRIVLLAVAALAGLLSGPYSLESAAQSEPPIEWPSLAFAFAGCLAAIPIVLGLQAALGNDKALRWGWLFFLVAATYFTLYSYNFCWPVRTLRTRSRDGPWQKRTPAMAAGLTDHVWSLAEWLKFPAVKLE